MAEVVFRFRHLGVMPGLDPGIHDAMPLRKSFEKLSLAKLIVDCRVKPGNDGAEFGRYLRANSRPLSPCGRGRLARRESERESGEGLYLKSFSGLTLFFASLVSIRRMTVPAACGAYFEISAIRLNLNIEKCANIARRAARALICSVGALAAQ